ncbi:MAG: acyl-CoA dehydrogenase domain protein [Solirubrobacterales bacterium]|nr:acyl-CoA dehydrogenase domain protein [Solirubrobacterales bacterium]
MPLFTSGRDVGTVGDMASSDAVLKPDHGTRQKHFIFTEEHERLRESIGSYVTKELRPHAEEWEEAKWFDSAVFPRMGELGFLGLSYPEQYGGQGGDYFCNLVLAEEITKAECGGLAMGIAVHTDMATPPVHLFGTEEQKQEYLVPSIKGTKISCLGITEPDAGSDVSGIKTRAVKDGDEYVINGAKTYITNGHRADYIVLVTKTDDTAGYDGFTLFLVDMDTPGVIREKKLEKLGMHASDTALLAFQDVRVPESAVLGQVGKGFYHIMWELQGERLIGAAGCVAGAELCMEKTLKYAMERTAFGRQIGKFQVTRHKFAEMATKIEAARQMVYTTAWRFDNGEYPVREISMAKLYASRIAVEVADECIQIHGGAGYMKEYGVERVWRDMRLNRIGAGTDEIMLDVIGRSYGL